MSHLRSGRHPATVDTTDADATDGASAPAGHDAPPVLRQNGHRNAVLMFAVAVPLAVLLLAGVLDLSMNYSEGLQARRGTIDSDRDLAAHRLTIRNDCWLDGLTSQRHPDRTAACIVKAQLHVDDHRSRVRIMLIDAAGHWTGRHAAGNSIVVCTQVAGRSVTGLLGFMLDDRVHQSATSLHIDGPSDSPGAEPVESAWERPLPGTTWAWCQPDSSTP